MAAILISGAVRADEASDHAEAVHSLVKASGIASLIRTGMLKGLASGAFPMADADLAGCLGANLPEDVLADMITPAMESYIPEADARRLNVFFGSATGQQFAGDLASGNVDALKALGPDIKAATDHDPQLQPSLTLFVSAMKLAFQGHGMMKEMAPTLVHVMLYECREQSATAMTHYLIRQDAQKQAAASGGAGQN